VDYHSFGNFATTVGIPTAILFVVLWFIRSWITNFVNDAKEREQRMDAKEREQRMAARIDTLEEFQKTTLLQILGILGSIIDNDYRSTSDSDGEQ
jgi:hypothetical protein